MRTLKVLIINNKYREIDMENGIERFEGEPQAMVWINPEDHMQQATQWANSLMSRVDNTFDDKGKPVYYSDLGGNKYLRVDAWEMIGKFAGVSAETEWEKELFDADGNVRGYRVKVKLVHKDTGEPVGGGAVMQCLLDSNVTKGQYTQDGKENAALSMAQTRATSKAFRLNFSFVAILGGYSSLPAEEITDEMRAKAMGAEKVIEQKPVPTSPLVEYAESQGAVVVESKPKPPINAQVSNSQPVGTVASMPPDSFTCPLHGRSFTRRDGNYGTYWSHPEESAPKGWCNLNNDKYRPEFATAWGDVIEEAHGYEIAEQVKAESEGQTVAWWLDKIDNGMTYTQCFVIGCGARADVEVNGTPTCLMHESQVNG